MEKLKTKQEDKALLLFLRHFSKQILFLADSLSLGDAQAS